MSLVCLSIHGLDLPIHVFGQYIHDAELSMFLYGDRLCNHGALLAF